eukprot:CAMPEP_0196159362 /NCGR_PEP_ID=MMETSP0910-20130528/46283_1 /TAXON_ID=49265 /ORGANISM="Thalassiosira rotula, Strain GSO102" /LENGTH=938 /DNA_ID=CAMNT_0041424281 /DNA_START=104 /DNA_END=2920 /DNA_ORIENTATION=-
MFSSSMHRISKAAGSSRGNNTAAAGVGAIAIAATTAAVASLVAATTTTSNANEEKLVLNDDDCDRIRGVDEHGEQHDHQSTTSPSSSSSSSQRQHHLLSRKDASSSRLPSVDRRDIAHALPLSPSITIPQLSSLSFTAKEPSLLPILQPQQCCQCESPPSDADDTTSAHRRRFLNIQRSRTLRILTSKATSHRTLSSLYDIDWNQTPIGEGAFGHVLLATSNLTNERVALKRIPKKLASREDFQREMEALLRIQKWGGHPHICALHEHFDEGGYYYLILDLVEGGEMFDHLVNHGAYSEADAARLVREVASALDFLHGIGVVHNDVKPENLMLSTVNREDGSIQLVDFGCAEVEGEDDDDDDHDVDEISTPRGGTRNIGGDGSNNNTKKNVGKGGFTPAYSSPEAFERRDVPPLPPADMWALGVIVYIMLTGVHPFDVNGRASDADIERDIRDAKATLPMGPNHPYTRHLSPSAMDLIRRLMERDPKKRLSAYEMLHHPWVTGETASTNIMAGSDKRLNKFRQFKTRLQTQFFADAVGWSDEAIVNPAMADETRRRTSLIERSFKAIDRSQLMVENMLSSGSNDDDVDDSLMASEVVVDRYGKGDRGGGEEEEDQDKEDMTMSDYHDLLSENMKQKYYPKGHMIYKEGDTGDHMYFINSGTVSVITEDGIKNKRHAGDFFGEGALLHPLKRRSTSIVCKTPVHVIEISREYFEKYMASSKGVLLSLREKDKIRKRNRAKALLKLQSGMKSNSFKFGERLYKEGDPGDSLYIVEEGKVDVTAGGHQVIVATEGNFCGEHSLLTGRLRNTTATCISKEGCKASRMVGRDFRKLMDASPYMKESLIDMMNRRDFKKAVVLRLGHEFPYSNPRKAWDAVDVRQKGSLQMEDVAELMRNMDKDYTDGEVLMMMEMLDLTKDGKVTYEEFEKMFIGDIRTTRSM